MGEPPEIDESLLDEIRRAAFELRHQSPQEAVRILRRCAAAGGGAEVLARGALGEIYLEDFGDLDGAESEFRKVLKAAPGLAAAELGLARVLREQGRAADAEAGFARAIQGLERDVRSFREAGEPPPGAEEVVLTALEVAIELCDLRARNASSRLDSPLEEGALRWAAESRLFDASDSDEEDAAGEDWVRFHALWARLRAITGRAEEAVAALERAEAEGQLPKPHGAKLRRDALEEAGDLGEAAVHARRALDEERAADRFCEALDVLRAAALTAASGDEPLAAKLLQEALSQTQARLASAVGDAREPLAEDEKRLREALEDPATSTPSLVRLGVHRQ